MHCLNLWCQNSGMASIPYLARTVSGPVHIASATAPGWWSLRYPRTASMEASLPMLPAPTLPKMPTRCAPAPPSASAHRHEVLLCWPATTVSIDMSGGAADTDSLACRPLRETVRPATGRALLAIQRASR